MPDETTQILIDALDELLDQERSALLGGDLEKLGGLLDRKEELMEQLGKIETVERAELELVQAKIDRNQLLLNSAMDGIRAVANRMAELRRVQNGLQTYDQAGRKTQLGIDSRPSVERRA